MTTNELKRRNETDAEMYRSYLWGASVRDLAIGYMTSRTAVEAAVERARIADARAYDCETRKIERDAQRIKQARLEMVRELRALDAKDGGL